MSETLRQKRMQSSAMPKKLQIIKAVRNRANAMRDYLRFNMAVRNYGN